MIAIKVWVALGFFPGICFRDDCGAVSMVFIITMVFADPLAS